MNNLKDNSVNNNEVEKLELTSLSFFNSDPYFNFVHKKSERLCMAIYLITDFFPTGDPIKDSLRKSGTELLRVSLSLITASSPCRKEILNSLSSLCVEIVSFTKIASNVGMTSVPNYNVIENEIKNFIGVIEDKERPSTTGQGFVLNGDAFSKETDDFRSVEKVVEKTKNENLISTPFEPKSYYHTDKKIDSDAGDIPHGTVVNTIKAPAVSVKKNESSVEGPVKSVMQKNERQQIILGIIKEIGESSIKDISDNIKDCSEKTIQRELNTLIYDGVLKKVGERRWSKYVLA